MNDLCFYVFFSDFCILFVINILLQLNSLENSKKIIQISFVSLLFSTQYIIKNLMFTRKYHVLLNSLF